jgi:zeaxanthin glucosyltransferase
MFSLSAVEPLARALNLPFVPFGQKDFPVEGVAEMIRKISRLNGKEALQYTVDVIAAITEAKWKTLSRISMPIQSG